MVKRVVSLALFSLAAVIFIGCGGDDSASNNSGNSTVVADRGSANVAEPDRNKQPRARLPIEARKNKQISTSSNNPDAVQPPANGDVETAEPDDGTSESDTVSPSDADVESAGESVPVKTASSKKTSAKKAGKRPSIGSLGSASPPKIPIMAEPSGKEGIGAGDTVIEIAGEDVDGEEFALSDYAGKVVMLDFWGDW